MQKDYALYWKGAIVEKIKLDFIEAVKKNA